MAKVLKFGGTSVGSAESIKNVAQLIENENATVIVLSAMSGTTDALLNIASLAAKGDSQSDIDNILEQLGEKYRKCIDGLLSTQKNEILTKVDETFEIIKQETAKFNSNNDYSEKLIVAQGELLTTAIFAAYLNESGRKAEWLYAPDFVRKDENEKVRMDLLGEKLGKLIEDRDTFYVTQGFICYDADGNMDNLGRGGSDYSAAVIGGAIGANQVQVWTDIDGMHNNDPRFVENTYPISEMSFDEAAELAYFGAKILHPATIQPCKDKGIPVKLKNTMDPTAKGTTISANASKARTFRAVAAKDGITVIRIYSARMLMAYGFLRKVFEIFEDYRTPIDMITTSEVAVSLTIDYTKNIDAIVTELKKLGTIEVEKDNSIVCIVGNMEHKLNGRAAAVMNGAKGVPLKMISYGASHHSIALLVETKYKKEILQNLNDSLFADKDA